MSGQDRVSPAERSGASNGSAGSAGIRERLAGAWTWVLLDANRAVLSGLVLLAVFVGSLLVWRFGPIPQAVVVRSDHSPGAFYSSFASLQEVTITVVVIVLGINQLILSPELGAVGRHRSRLADVLDYREDADAPSPTTGAPAEPSQFLEALLRGTEERAKTLRDRVASSDEAVREPVSRYVCRLVAESEDTRLRLEGRPFGDVSMYRAAMSYDDGRLIYDLRQLERALADDLAETQRRAMDELLDALKLFASGRDYFTTIYLQTEFANFSRALLITGVVSLVAASYGAQLFRPSVFAGTTLGVRDVLWVVSGAYTVTLVPLALLVSYVARLVTVTKQTLVIGPFVTRGETGEGTVLDRPPERAD